MNKHVIFIQGGGENGYEADAKLVASLRTALGEKYNVDYPQMPSVESLPDFGWLERIGEEISLAKDKIILVGHSLGASMLLKYLSESQVQKIITGIFLIATPFWSGDEDWKQGLKLHKDFAVKIQKSTPIFFYQCKDDKVVPVDHLELYKKNLPQATICILESGGHQLNNDLSLIAKDIKSL